MLASLHLIVTQQVLSPFMLLQFPSPAALAVLEVQGARRRSGLKVGQGDWKKEWSWSNPPAPAPPKSI